MKANLKELILSNFEELMEKMKQHEGIDLALKQRLTFEKWLQIELAGQLHHRLKSESNIAVVLEAPTSKKISKRAKSIDIAIQRGNEKLFSIELKIIATSYKVAGIEIKSKGITDKVDELIKDLNKSQKDNYQEYMSLAFVFPFPIQANHRNNRLDFPKHLKKLEEYGQVECSTFQFDNRFNVAFVSLYNRNEKVPSRSQKIDLSETIKIKESGDCVIKSSSIGCREIASSSSAVEHNVVVGFKLGKEYYEKGIIAFSKGYDKYLPVSSGTKVKIFINREPQQLSGNFTRATNGNRRFINGYSELVQYYKQNFKVDDIVQVRILSNSEYQIFQ
jgi:hypothetical protein